MTITIRHSPVALYISSNWRRPPWAGILTAPPSPIVLALSHLRISSRSAPYPVIIYLYLFFAVALLSSFCRSLLSLSCLYIIQHLPFPVTYLLKFGVRCHLLPSSCPTSLPRCRHHRSSSPSIDSIDVTTRSSLVRSRIRSLLYLWVATVTIRCIRVFFILYL
jgi:hypothetical protein